jgi:hypothetical protein
MEYNESPSCTTYCCGTPVEVGAPIVVLVCKVVFVFELDELPPSVSKLEIMAKKAKAHVLHNRYM